MKKLLELVLTASLPANPTSALSWQKANEMVPLEEWPGEVSRLVSCFFTNHGRLYNSANASLLKGVYKANWSRNSLSLKSIIPIFQDFDNNGVDYRLIKGGAIVLYLNQFGARRMGDLDVVVHNESRIKVRKILTAHSFRPRYLGDRRSLLNEVWENADGIVLDLHYIKKFNYHKIAFIGHHSQKFLDYSFKLPSIESSILIALKHGYINHSRGDESQALWDVSMLYDKSNLKTLEKLAIDYAMLEILQNAILKLNSMGMHFEFEVHTKRLNVSLFRTRARVRNIVNRLSFTNLPRIWNMENTNLINLRIAATEHRAFIYIIWGLFGMLRPIERFVTIQSGGLLPQEKIEYLESCVFEINDSDRFSNSRSFTSGNLFANEIRVQLACPSNIKSKLDLQLNLESFQPRMIFIDGIAYGHLTPSLGNRYGYHLDTPNDRVEISFRDFSKCSTQWTGKIQFCWTPDLGS